MEGAETLHAREYADADALVSAAAAAASAGDGTVTLTNLRVTHRKRRGAKQFWVTAAAMGHGTFEVQMSFRRADLDDAGCTGDAGRCHLRCGGDTRGAPPTDGRGRRSRDASVHVVRRGVVRGVEPGG